MPAARRCSRLKESLTATALVATAGNGRQFKNGRHLSAYLGLVPGHSNTGNKTVMLPITKRGSRYLRTLLVHGTRHCDANRIGSDRITSVDACKYALSYN